MYHGLPPTQLSALYFFIPWISYHTHGKYYIKGGAQALSNSFVDVIKNNGGEVHLKSTVENILFENNKYSECGFLLTNYNSMDESLNSPKNGVLTMTYIDNYNYWSSEKEEYKLQKIEVKKEMILRLEKYYPGISNHIVIAELGIPRTMERYTKNPLGAVYGYRQNIKQAGRYRLTKKTSIKNLSLVGA